MSKAYNNPTADRAISEADKWEKRQQELEALHGIKRGDTPVPACGTAAVIQWIN